MYGCFFPGDLVKSHSINLLLIIELQYLESSLQTLLVMSSKLSGCQEQTLFKKYA